MNQQFPKIKIFAPFLPKLRSHYRVKAWNYNTPKHRTFTQQKHHTFTQQSIALLHDTNPHGRSIVLLHWKSIILCSAPTVLFTQQETQGLGGEFHSN
jgi:hypothetical protein